MIWLKKISIDNRSLNTNEFEKRRLIRQRQHNIGISMVEIINKLYSYSHVSKTHKAQYVAIIAENYEVGIDIEHLSLNQQNLKFLGKSERRLCMDYDSGLIWSLKESIAKLMKCGLKRLDDVVIYSICEDRVYAKIRSNHKKVLYISFKFYWWIIENKYVMAIVRL